MRLSGGWQVLVDCSTFLSGIFYPLGKPYRILELWVNKEYDLCVTEEIVKEYELKIESFAKRVKKDPRKAELWLKLINRLAIFVKPQPVAPDSCRDPNDLKYLEAAKACEVDFLISSDNDLLVVKKFGKTQIVTPDKFLKVFAKKQEA